MRVHAHVRTCARVHVCTCAHVHVHVHVHVHECAVYPMVDCYGPTVNHGLVGPGDMSYGTHAQSTSLNHICLKHARIPRI